MLALRTQQLRKMQKQLAQDAKGKVRITITYPPGRPLLSQQEASQILDTHFGPNTGPRPEELKDTHGLKVEGVSNLRWASNVEPMGQWPIKLQHPTLGKHMYYMYLNVPLRVHTLTERRPVCYMPPEGLQSQE